MRNLNRHRFLILVSVALLAVAGVILESKLGAQAAGKTEYVCPPCGCGKDQDVFERPGSCSSCGMALVEKGSEASRPRPQRPQEPGKKVALLIFDGVEIIDYAGPYEVFGQAGFDVYTVAASEDSITTAMGMKVTPAFSFSNCPQPDILVIPGGNVFKTQDDQAAIKWIQDRAKEAEHVLSVCNGAFILAKTGLLDGLAATTFYNLIDGLAAVAPKTKVVSDQRYVDNGKIITTAGLSSGIDGSLYVVSKMRGKAAAQLVALNMEYNWQPGAGYARANFADRHLRKVFSNGLTFPVPSGASLKLLDTEGGPEKWEAEWQVQGSTSAIDVINLLNEKLANYGKWSRIDETKTNNSAKSGWQFIDEKGAHWKGSVKVETAAGDRNKLLVSLSINRISAPTAVSAR